MITADHLAEAKAYVDELTVAGDYIPGTPEWVEHIVSAAAIDIDSDALYAWCGTLEGPSGTFTGYSAAGCMVALLAQQLANRDTDTAEEPSQHFATLPKPSGVGWPE